MPTGGGRGLFTYHIQDNPARSADRQMQEPHAVRPSDPPLTLRTLGGIGLYSGDADAPVLGAGKPIALLVYLRALPGRRASREHLLDVLWADLEPTAARHALRQMTLYLRQRAGTHVLEATDGELALTTSFGSDRDAFLDAVESGNLPEAVALYRGEFLPGFAVPGGVGFEHWADTERQRLRLLFQRAAESLAREHLKQGHFRRARDLARRARDADPLDESGWRLLLEACLAQGDRVTAFAEGQRLEEVLNAENRLPEPATRVMLRQVKAEPDDAEQPSEHALVAELIGREREFAALLAAFGRARRGAAQVASVVAPAGLGKTRLLRDLAHRLAAGGNTAVYVRAHPGDRDVPWSYAAEVVRQLAARPGAGGVSPATAASLVALDPSLSGRFSATPDPATGDEAYRRRSAAVAELVQAVSEERPLALLFDDQHWADPTSRDALQRMVPRVRGARVLLVFAARPGDALHRLEADEAFSLAPLDGEQVDALVASFGALPDAPWTQDLGVRLHAATSGSPLLVLETLQLALESGCLGLAEGRWSCGDPKALDALLEAGSALARRIAQLDRVEGWLLLVLALAGTPLKSEPIAAASGRDRERTLADLQVLERRGLVARFGDEWSVAHDEIAAEVEARADPRQRGAAHAALGRGGALLAESSGPATLRAAARHLAAASLDQELASLATRWIRAARASGDRRTARALVEDLLGSATDGDRVRSLVASLPWTVRFDRGRILAAAGAVVAVLAVASLGALWRTSSDDSGLLIGAWVQEQAGLRRLHARRLTGRDLRAGRVALTSLRATPLMSGGWSDGEPRPGAGEVVATSLVYRDSGGVDVALLPSDGSQATRLTYRRGDDWMGAWSPDGRWLVIATDRWSQRSHSDLAILDPDHPDSIVTRLTSDPAARDVLPLWSPDGARIVFVRTYLGAAPRPSRLCLVSVDGAHERCLDVPAHAAGQALGWASAVEIVAVFQDSGGAATILAVHTETGQYRTLVEGVGTVASRATGWISCFCRRHAGEPWQTLVLPAADPARAIRIEPGDPPPDVVLFPSSLPQTYLDRLRIEPVPRPVPADGTYRLRIRGWDRAGRPVEPLAVRWTSRDTATATVDSSGVVHPRREGNVVVHATSGGWRSDSARVAISPAEARTVVVEDWREGIGPRWVSFGEPRPLVVETDRGAALAPNGDSTFSSGVYLGRDLPTADGVGIELDVSAPITDREWQNLSVTLLSVTPADRRGWDLEKGYLPVAQQEWRSCGIAYPAFRSPGGPQLGLFAGVHRILSVAASMSRGEWVRIRIQFFPDGRCGAAVNGEPQAIADRLVPLRDSATLLIGAYSHRTRILVGHLEAWTGVRRDLDWSALDRTAQR